MGKKAPVLVMLLFIVLLLVLLYGALWFSSTIKPWNIQTIDYVGESKSAHLQSYWTQKKIHTYAI